MLQSISINPGFALLIGAIVAFAAPRPLRALVMTLAPLATLALVLWRPFGEYRGFSQIGLEIIRFRIDELSLVFGLHFAITAILIGVASGARNDRNEDAAMLAMGGAAGTAAFSGDLITFVAASELSALAGFWIILTAGGRAPFEAGLRFLIWQGLGGLLMLCGVAFHLADGFDNAFTRLPADSLGGGFILTGLAIKAAGPLAHVWFKEAAAQASPIGAAAIAAYSTPLALYALMRGYAGEEALSLLGLGAAIIGAVYALAEDNMRRALGYSAISQAGLIVAGIGAGAPGEGAAPGFAPAALHVLTMGIAYFLMFAALGATERGEGAVRASGVRRDGVSAPAAAALGLIGALSAAGAPGLAGYVSESLLRETLAAGPPVRSLALLGAGAATIAFCLVRMPMALFGGRPAASEGPRPGAFRLYLAMALSAFLCLAVGLAPDWILGLSPSGPLSFDALSPARVAARLEFLGAAASGAILAASLGLSSHRRPRDLADVDAFYEGPAARFLGRAGGALLRTYEAGRAGLDVTLGRVGVALDKGSRRFDQPHRDAGFLQSLSLGVILCLVVGLYLFST
ncbi:MAG: hypothetical protein GC206_06085 [Alphaproteobacteria bacterium]|nr:hypothetical protein [Alphaproteobacteria bacterium]